MDWCLAYEIVDMIIHKWIMIKEYFVSIEEMELWKYDFGTGLEKDSVIWDWV